MYGGARTFQICTRAKALVKLTRWTPRYLTLQRCMDLLNATADHDRQGQAAHRRYRQITQSS